MAGKLPRIFFEHFTGTSFAAKRDGRLAGFLAWFISQSRPDEAYIHFAARTCLGQCDSCQATQPREQNALIWRGRMGHGHTPIREQADRRA